MCASNDEHVNEPMKSIPSILIPEQQFDMIDDRRAIQFDTDIVDVVDRMSRETTVLATCKRRMVGLTLIDEQTSNEPDHSW